MYGKPSAGKVRAIDIGKKTEYNCREKRAVDWESGGKPSDRKPSAGRTLG